MSILGFYFVGSLLRKAGWPRKQGLFRAVTIDTAVADLAINQMVDWGASLGAGRPTIALRIIAEMFRDRDWEGDNAPDINTFVNSSRESWDASPDATPCDIVQPVRLSPTLGKAISAKRFESVDVTLEQDLLWAILLGMANPERFAEWYADAAQRHESSLSHAQSCGLAVDSLPTLDEFFENSEQIIRDYEREVQPLPTIPARLLADARSIGANLVET